MNLKKILSSILATTGAICLMTTPVFAQSVTESFYIIKNGGPDVSSKSALKELPYSMSFSVSRRPGTDVKWKEGVEYVYSRGRTNDGGRCTKLAHYAYSNTYSVTYDPGHGTIGKKYRLAMEYDSSNPGTHLDLQARWTP